MATEGNWDGCVIGMFTHDSSLMFPKLAGRGIYAFEKLIGKRVGSVMWYITWDDAFPVFDCDIVSKLKAMPHLTWELFWPSVDNLNTRAVASPSVTGLDDVLAGRYDEYIDAFARDAGEWGGKILIRFLHEFNGNWYIWGGKKNGGKAGGPQKVVAVWKYVVDRFRAAGAYNVKWIWCPHGPSIDLPEDEWNDLENYWPGEEYVDWIGLDAYNWYPEDPWGGARPFRDFDNCFRQLYDECVLIADRPIMIAEFATCEFSYEGLTKAQWIKQAFMKIKNEYPKIKLFTWFNINKELDWRVNSSAEALKAFKQAMADDYFIAYPLE
ncbi:MAG: hypothetical protein JW822_02090 [Spirochaetales bacterium]|nr:hypothetical protein [Spirochaetales bacterium]